jgi:hypothetical protein
MRALFLAVLLLAGFVSQAKAQLAVGPITINNDVNGVPIAVSATSWVTVNSVDNDLMVDARIFADLIDLQRKFSNVVDTFGLSADECANRGADNQSSVVSFKRGALWPRDDQLVMSTRGHIDIWSCVATPPKSEIRWLKKKIGFLRLRVPVYRTWTKVTKSKDGTQSFRRSLPIQLVRKDNATIALKLAKPDLMLEGEDASLTNANLQLAMADIDQKVYNALQSAIDPVNLKKALPEELQKLNMTVVSARFRDHGGHAIAEINLAAKVSGNSIMQLLQQTAANPANRIGKADQILYTLR